MPDFFIVDVFAEGPYTGNQLAVVVSAQTLADEKMQLIAAEANYSETTFVSPVPESNGGYRVRIFTPAREIAFAGHPILGTAWVIRNQLATGATRAVWLNLAVGSVPVTFEPAADGREVAWFGAPPVVPGPVCDREAMAVALGLVPEDIDVRSPIQKMTAGISAMIVPLRSLDALRRSRLELAAYAPLVAQGFPQLTYLYCRETHHPENDLCARFFFEAHGVREDPATGNGAAFLGSYLLQHALYPEAAFSLRIEQGYELGRPSLVLLRGRVVGGRHEVSVGGRVIPIVEGRLL